MNAATLSPVNTQARPRWRKWPYVLLAIVVLLGGGYAGFAVVANWKLRNAVAEVERSDPRWRLDQIEADRADIAEKDNSALVVMAIKPLIPKNWPAWEVLGNNPQVPPGLLSKVNPQAIALNDSFKKLQPQRRLNKEQIAALRHELERASLARTKAHKLATLPQGRYPIVYSDDFLATKIPHIQTAREVVRLLKYEAMLQAQDGDTAAALTSCRAMVNTARSIGDSVFLVSQLVRIASRSLAVDALERGLAQGQPAKGTLRELQQLLEKEESEPLLLFGLRGERGGDDQLYAYYEANSGFFTRQSNRFSLLYFKEHASPPEEMARLPWFTDAGFQWQRAAHLRYMTRMVAAAQLPLTQRRAEIESVEKDARDLPPLARFLVPAVDKVAAACYRSRMRLRCTSVALAAERYRIDEKKWPENLDALSAAGDIAEVPMDLFDGQPLRMKRTKDGLLIYSVGPDGQDNGGRLKNVNNPLENADMGFRLWDADKRRQAADDV